MRVEPIRFWTEPKSDFLNRFVVLASRLELLDLENFENLRIERVDSVSRGIDSKPYLGLKTELELQWTIGSSKCLWGSCVHVGQELTSQLTVAAGGLLPTEEKIINDRGRLIGPPGKYERWLSGASTGPMQVVTSSLAARLRPLKDRALIIVSTFFILVENGRGYALSSTSSGLKLGGGSLGCYI
ncbi:hypothetical protein PIB30_047512 [Stylosanthes scabra]|uniref:Uncharacterized protein n=1 Tax=Stylosanthes scabra TaxID=79078 RepID=A0ABU6WJI1_9FABA|nr:hypothetical protein [Stylosanthes scabra]